MTTVHPRREDYSTSPHPKQQQYQDLEQIIPEAFAEGKLDKRKLLEALDLSDESGNGERYSFTWAGKRDAQKILQVPSRATLIPAPEESIDWETTENVFIEGENLEVLKLLLKPYFGRVKMIYIDPPYNTGNDFVYPDNYADPLDTYLRLTGQKDSNGNLVTSNPETSGRYHSAWLSMMYPRLFLARQLLREDGVIFVSIDDHEVHNLRAVMNEVFGEENHIGTVMWNSTKSVTNTALISVGHTYNLVYARSKEYFVKNRHHFRLKEDGDGFSNPDNDPRGPWKADPFQVGGWRPNQQYEITNPKTGETYLPNDGCSWKNDFETYKTLVADNRIVFGSSGEAGPQRKRFQSEAEERGRVAKTWWDDVGTTTQGTMLLKDLFGGDSFFSNPKPVDFIKRLIELGDHTGEGIILDFFAGSGTTAHATMELNAEDGGNRRYILVQLAELLEKDSTAAKAGFRTIADITKERIRRVGEKLKDKPELDTGFRVYKLTESNFRPWNGIEDKDHENYADQMELFISSLKDGWKDAPVIAEIALKEGYSLTSQVEAIENDQTGNTVWRITDPDKEQSFHVCLDSQVTLETVRALNLEEDDLFIYRDSAGDDTIAANIALQCRIKTI